MKSMREKQDVKAIMRMLSTDLQKNVCGIANPQLYKVAWNGTKDCIEEYQ
jgi:hypothetical protein